PPLVMRSCNDDNDSSLLQADPDREGSDGLETGHLRITQFIGMDQTHVSTIGGQSTQLRTRFVDITYPKDIGDMVRSRNRRRKLVEECTSQLTRVRSSEDGKRLDKERHSLLSQGVDVP